MNSFQRACAEMRLRSGWAVVVILLIAASVAIGVSMSATERGFRLASARAADRFDLLIGAPGSSTQLVLSTVFLQPTALELLAPTLPDALRADAGIGAIALVAFGDSILGSPLVGITAEFLTNAGKIAMSEGRQFTNSHEAIAGALVPLAVGSVIRPSHGTGETGDSTTTSRHAFDLTIVGRLPATRTPWDYAVAVPFEAIGQMHHHDGAGPAAIIVTPRTLADAYRLRHNLRAQGLMAVFPAEVLAELLRLYGDVAGAATSMLQASQVLAMASALIVALALLLRRHAAIGTGPAASLAADDMCATCLQLLGLCVAGLLGGVGFGWGLLHLIAHSLAKSTRIEMSTALRSEDWRVSAIGLASVATCAVLLALLSRRVLTRNATSPR
jgi:putative ABC transport system permease protein